MKNKLVYIVLILITILSTDIIIFLDLENFGNTLSDGGFAPQYGFQIKNNIFIMLCIISITMFIYKKCLKKNIKVWIISLTTIITTILIYNLNFLIFSNYVPDRYDFDSDGLSNTYEKKIGTNPILQTFYNELIFLSLYATMYLSRKLAYNKKGNT